MNRERETEDLVARLRALPLVQPRSELRAQVFDRAPPPLRQVLAWGAALAAIIIFWVLIPPFRAETPTRIQVGEVVLEGPVTTSPSDAFRTRYSKLQPGG